MLQTPATTKQRIKTKTHKNQFLSLLIFGVLFFCLASGLLYAQVSGPRPHCDTDSMAYVERAELLLQTGSFYNPQSPALPYYGLGYAFFIAFCNFLFGGGLGVIVVAQVALALLNFYIIYAITKKLFCSQAAGLSLFFSCTSIGYLVFAQFMLTEVLLATFIAATFLCALSPDQRSSATLAGAWLGLSIIVKPAALYLIIPLGLLWFLKNKINALIFTSIFLLFLGGIISYNYVVFNQPKLGNLATINLCYWFYPYLLAHEHATNVETERAALAKRLPEPAQVMPLLLDAVKQKPLLACWYWGFNMIKTTLGLYASNLKVLTGKIHPKGLSFFKQQGTLLEKIRGYLTTGASEPWVVIVAIIEIIFLLIRYIFLLIGLYFLWQAPSRKIHFFIAILFLCYFIAITGHDGCARFRMMVEFLLISLAAGGGQQLYLHFRKPTKFKNSTLAI